MDPARLIRARALAAGNALVYGVIASVAAVQIVVGIMLLLGVGYPRWRLGVTCLLGLATVVVTKWKYRWEDGANGVLAMATTAVHVGLFGGMLAMVEGPGSPLGPLLFHVAVGSAGRYGLNRNTAVGLAASLGVLVLLGLAPGSWFGPPVPEPERSALWVVMLGGVIVTQFVQLAATRRAYGRAADELDDLRETILRDHTARARGLETIGAKVAHELKNPLTSVKALLQIMAEDAATEDDRSRHVVLESEVGRMQTILQDYLSFARPLDELRNADIDLLSLTEHVTAVMSARARTAEVALVVSGDPTRIRGDEGRLRGALLNLVGNAVEATPRGGTVGASVRPNDDGAMITIRDTGVGMSARQLAKLGTPYVTTKPTGTGLGVVVATATIRQHGGTIDYESTEGKGTTVQVFLPARPPATASSDPSASYEKLSRLELASILEPSPAGVGDPKGPP
ncbi:MAG: HAMP domain-containing sensor histidine kinase [Myxococcota bacterium]